MRKPISGAIWGLILGIAAAIVLQQQGIWPLDKITVFLLPGAVGLIGVLITTVGRAGSTSTLVVAVVITGAASAYGATGLGDVNEVGQLNGGCTVKATSAVDATTVTDTSRQDPFDIDPKAGLSWEASSGGSVFDDYPWRMYVEIGGSQVTIDEEASENNDDGDTENSDSVTNVQEYGESRGIPVSQLRGVYKVGGFASVCNGFGFVRILSDPLESIISKVALALALIALIMLLRAALGGRGGGPNGLANGGPNGTDGGNGDRESVGDPDLNGDVEADDVGGAADGTNGDDDSGGSIASTIAASGLVSGYEDVKIDGVDLSYTLELEDEIASMRPGQEPPPLPSDGPPSEPPDPDSSEEPEPEKPLPGLEE